jgi:hypothetical protein
MPKNDRTRIDYMPGQAAFDALALAGEMFPNMRPQAVIDKPVAGPGCCAPDNYKVTARGRQELEKESREIKPVAIMQPHIVLMGCVMGFESRLIFFFKNQRLTRITGGEGGIRTHGTLRYA